jgi:hypothetical protein
MYLHEVGRALDRKYRMQFTEMGERLVGIAENVENIHYSMGLPCNFKCVHCPVTGHDKTVEKYRRKSDELGVDLGNPMKFTDPELVEAGLELFPKVAQIGLGCGGGEPMLNPQYKRVLEVSRNFFGEKAKAIPAEERAEWWTQPYYYGITHGNPVDVHFGGRIVLFTNASLMPNKESELKDFLLDHQNVTFEVSYDLPHQEMYRQSGLDLDSTVHSLDRLAGDSDVRNAGVRLLVFHTGDLSPKALQKEFPNSLVNVGYVINFGDCEVPGTIKYYPRAFNGKKGHEERHIIMDSQGNLFNSMNNTYAANFDFLCGIVRKVETDM